MTRCLSLTHQYSGALDILLRESELEKVGVGHVSVQHEVVEEGVLLALLLVPHVDVAELEAGALLGVLVTLQLGQQGRLSAAKQSVVCCVRTVL